MSVKWGQLHRPRLVVTRERNDFGARSSSEASISQGFGRIRVNDEIVLTAGRELFTWGPAYFRSPSNPFYFDAGKTRPLQDVPGADLVRLSATMNSLSISTAFVEQGSSIPASKRHSRVIKADYRGADYSIGGIWSGTTRDSQFFGGFAQFTVDDALLLYAEGSSMPRDSTAPGSPGRPLNGLIGGAYTFDSGKSLAVEILHDQRGFTLQAERAYFEQAANRDIATQLNGVMPPLLGRSYFYVLWQSNLQDTSRYWRVSLTENVLDHSRQFQVYAELPAGARLTLFGSLVQNFGPLRSEFSSVVRTSFTLGIKAFAF